METYHPSKHAEGKEDRRQEERVEARRQVVRVCLLIGVGAVAG